MKKDKYQNGPFKWNSYQPKGGENVEKVKRIRDFVKEFLQEEDAVGVVEIILILVVLIGLVMIFKEQLTSLVKTILSKITKQSNSI